MLPPYKYKGFGVFTTLLTLGSVLGMMGVAEGATVNYSGDTTGEPTWQRPVQGNPPVPPLSSTGTAVPYSVQPFFVDQAGQYDFLSTATNAWDNYIFLYQNNFDSTDQFTNVIIGNDDFPSIGISGFDGVSLSTGINYFFVTTGFSNNAFGVFDNIISGPGNITLGLPVTTPEPSLMLGLIGVGAVLLGGKGKNKK